jgi:hypothetical protein
MLDAHPKSAISSPASRPHQEGRIAIVTDVGRGMQWTRWRRKTSGVVADGEAVWSWRPDAGVKSAEAIPPVTVAKEPGHRGEHGVNVKTIVQGRLGETGEPVVTMLVWFFHSHARLRVRSEHRLSLRPLFSRDMLPAQLGRQPRERGVAFERQVLSDDSIRNGALAPYDSDPASSFDRGRS